VSEKPHRESAQSVTNPPWHGVPTAVARRFHQICSAKTAEVVGEAGLTPLQYGALIHLSRLTGKPGLEQNSLADRLNVDRNTASLLVEQLVKKGVVEREVNGADRRSRLLSLTPRGERLYERLRPRHLAANEGLLAPLAARERRLLMNLLIRVIEANLAQASRGSAGGKRQRMRQL
jgi:MarR family transcriptional regulator, lower aerobic nicotinate degradation pathway regulator